MTDALIVDAVRSPIGRRHGTLSVLRGDDLSAQVVNGLLDRNGVEPGEIEDVQWGCVTQIDEQAWNIGRNVALAAGWPVSVCGTTVDRQCGSSMQTNFNAAAAIMSGQLDLVVSGGVEMMSRVPMGSNNGSMSDAVLERFEIVPQGISAEVIADRWHLSREALDDYSYESHRRAIAAIDEGRFEREIVPVEVGAGGAAVLVATDENPRRDTSLEKLAGLKPAFKEDGKITAGNSSQISDGAAAVLLMTPEKAKELGVTPRAKIVDQTTVGVDPVIMLTGPIPATRKILERNGMQIGDIDLIEINEAFSSVVIAWERELKPDLDRVNVNGGAIALGHPVGASGSRLFGTLLAELERRDAEIGLVTMCCGGGLGTATLVQRIDG